jgi:hypothetical protein
MKEQLKNLYTNNINAFNQIRLTFPNEQFDLPGPFLMSPNTLYSRQKRRLLIIGQQTKGWTYDVDIEKQQSTYESFNVGENYYSSPFWNITRKLEKAVGNDAFSCAWTNINKFDLEEDRPYGEFEQAISKLDSILIEEINIIKPEVCMFFTGPAFDYRIKNLFLEIELIEIEGWSVRQFCRLKHKDLPEKSFRSYHPKALRIQQLEDKFIKDMENIFDND